MNDNLNLGELLSASIDAAQKAGQIIRKIWKSGELNIAMKGKDDPFTDADIKSQQLIMALLRKQFGDDLAMVGEEETDIPATDETPNVQLIDLKNVPAEYQSVSKKDVCIFIDPLDATKEFTDGNLPAVMSLVGIGYKGTPVAGVMFQPFVEDAHGANGTTMWGMIGMGVHGVECKQRNDNRFVIATTRTHGGEEIDRAVTLLKPDEVLRVGGAGYKCMLVLNGVIDAYIFPTPGTKKWDTCAPEAILRAAGGTLTDKFGNNLPYFKDSRAQNLEGLLASMKNHQHIVDVLNQK